MNPGKGENTKIAFSILTFAIKKRESLLASALRALVKESIYRVFIENHSTQNICDFKNYNFK